MRRWLILVALALACAGNRPPANFLRTEFQPWNDWMKTMVSVDLTNVPLGALFTRTPLQGMQLTLTDVDPEYRIELLVEHASRRQALWMLAAKYGLSITVARDAAGQPAAVTIAPRELPPPNKPLP